MNKKSIFKDGANKNLTHPTNKKAISLIVLVITIIVMAILASVVIINIGKTDIIESAKDSVYKTDTQQAQMVAQLAYADALLQGAKTDAELETAVKNSLIASGLDPEDYGMIVTTEKFKIVKGWLQVGETIRKGSRTLTLGTPINYDETAGGKVSVPQNVTWYAVGADEQGNLLIGSTASISQYTITDPKYAYENWTTILSGICEPYGHGRGAVGKARTVTLEDINKITGYDPNTYCVGDVNQYGATATIKGNGSTRPSYVSSVTGEGKMNYTETFYYYDDELKRFESVSPESSAINGENIDTVTNTQVRYWLPVDLYDDFVLASRFECFWGTIVNYGFLYYTSSYNGTGSYVKPYTIFQSNGNEIDEPPTMNVRAVVALSSDIRFTDFTEDGYCY